MLQPKIAGRNAAALKYDLLTAMGAYALSAPKGPQRLVLRLMTLITARYNWGRDQLAVGQREIARLWAVDERTVKREMAKLRAMGWLDLRRAGGRGRVAEYGLGIARILADTQARWADVGPDFALRLGVPEVPDNVVPLAPRGTVPDAPALDGTEWSLAQGILHAEDAVLYGAWIARLRRVGCSGGRLTLRAPTRFHASYVTAHLVDRLVTVVQSVEPEVSDVVIVV